MCVGDSLCYEEQDIIAAYLNRPDIRDLLGAQSPGNFTGCSREVGRNFDAHLDKFAVPSQHYVAGLLERGVPILIYAGKYEYRCNWVSNKLWVDKLEWSGKADYKAEDWSNWEVDGRTAGETKSSGILTFATVRGAGHMGTYCVLLFANTCTNVPIHLACPAVPHDKPAEAFAMVSRWLAARPL